MNFQRGQTKEDPEINLIALIDVLLVILIFLMVSTTYSKFAELKINLPSAEASPQPTRSNEINVVISATGQIIVDKTPVVFKNAEYLSEDLKRAAGTNKDPVIIINADAKATHQTVISVMEAARLAGFVHVSFATQTTK